MQVIGLCRFSYPALGGFQVEHDTVAERIAYLYSEERMEERFRLFETVALPSLRAQTDADFDLIIVTGDSLPRHHRGRLQDLTADMPQVRIVAEPPRRHRQVMKEILNAARRNPDQPCLQFRADDDDAVAVEFVERLRETAADCAGLLKKTPIAAIDFNRGYIAEFGARGIAASEPAVRSYFTAALGMYAAGGVRQTIMNFGHHRIHHHMPSITITDVPMWVRSHNTYNDSRQRNAGAENVVPLAPKQEREFATMFGIKASHVRAAFTPQLSGSCG
ncbi:putative rhamnosyl transferase [Leisingera sp. ANG-M7]|uniref:putative rhamnosyl transferase n=1 Tax=Leisingera sp. ANG-M7 TaxID=1577902 RepID=UPI00057D7EC3|nr:putative rhamnosyl transferase [Leisingera sp. ANG-M7]KIC32468.1 hypothetical protein RA26_21650 [Leisingera sp. ANG-M7]